MEELSRTRKVPLCISSPRSIRAVLHLTRALVPSSMMQRALTEGPHCALSLLPEIPTVIRVRP